MKFVCSFFGLCCGQPTRRPAHGDQQSFRARTSLLASILVYFTATYPTERDVHSVAAACDADVRQSVLSSYCLALAALKDAKVADISGGPASGDASVFALFWWSRCTPTSPSTISASHTWPHWSPPSPTRFLNLLHPHERLHHSTHVSSWLAGTKPRPSIPYLASVPVAFPLIGLTRLVQYLVVCRVSGITPGQLRDRISGATGQSQGVVLAAAIAALTSFESFTENTKKAIRWLFFCGLRAQEALLSLEPSIVARAAYQEDQHSSSLFPQTRSCTYLYTTAIEYSF